MSNKAIPFNIDGVNMGLREMFRRVIYSTNFNQLKTLTEQILLIKQYCPVASNEEIAIVMKCKTDEVERIVSGEYMKTITDLSNTDTITADDNTIPVIKTNEQAINEIRQLSKELTTKGIAFTDNSIQCYVEDYCEGVNITFESLKLTQKKVKITKILKQAEEEDLIGFYSILKEKVEGVSPQFVFNADEFGFQTKTLEDNVVIRSNLNPKKIEIDRNSKVSHLFCCICADGSSLPLYCVVSENKQLKEIQNNAPRKCSIQFSDEMTCAISLFVFERWLNMFIENVNNKRIKLKCFNEKTILIIAEYYKEYLSSHNNKLIDNNIDVIYIPNNSEREVQPLNEIFDCMVDKRKNYFKINKLKVSESSKELLISINSWKIESVEGNILDAFKNKGIIYMIIGEKPMCCIEKKYQNELESSKILDDFQKPRKSMELASRRNSQKLDYIWVEGDFPLNELSISVIPKDESIVEPKKVCLFSDLNTYIYTIIETL